MEDYRKHADLALLELLKGGDGRAMTEIYKRYWPLLFTAVTRMVDDRDAAYDLVQDVLVSLWERREGLVINETLKAYLYAAARKKVLLGIRSSRMRGRYEQAFKDVWQEGSPSSEESLIERELHERFEAELENLPEKMREAFQLSRIEHYTYNEIAEKMHISDHTVKQHISKALKRLRKRMLSLFFLSL